GLGRVGEAGGCPTINCGIISAAGVQTGAENVSAPDNHFAPSPHCRVAPSPIGCVDGASGCPTVDGKRFVVRADEKLTAFLELTSVQSSISKEGMRINS